MKLTIVISKGEEFYIGTIKEIPAVLTQGSSIEETKENVLDALELYLKDMQSENNDANKVFEEDLNFAWCLLKEMNLLNICKNTIVNFTVMEANMTYIKI